MSSSYSKPLTTRKASPSNAVAEAPRTSRRSWCRASAACAAIAMVRLLVSRTAVLTVPYQMSVSRAGGGEGLRMLDAADRVGQQQRAEEQHFAGEEDPDAERCRPRAAGRKSARVLAAGALASLIAFPLRSAFGRIGSGRHALRVVVVGAAIDARLPSKFFGGGGDVVRPLEARRVPGIVARRFRRRSATRRDSRAAAGRRRRAPPRPHEDITL